MTKSILDAVLPLMSKFYGPVWITWAILLTTLGMTSLLSIHRMSLAAGAAPHQSSGWSSSIFGDRLFKTIFLQAWIIIAIIRVGLLFALPLIVFVPRTAWIPVAMGTLNWPEEFVWKPLPPAAILALGSSLPAACWALLSVGLYRVFSRRGGRSVTLRLRHSDWRPDSTTGHIPPHFAVRELPPLQKAATLVTIFFLLIGCIWSSIWQQLGHVPAGNRHPHFPPRVELNAASSVAFSYNGNLIVMTDHGPAHWNPNFWGNAGPDPTANLQSDDHTRGVHDGGSLGTFSSHNDMLTTFVGDEVQVRDPSSYKTQLSLAHPEVVDSVAFSPDDKRLAVGGQKGAIVVWDVATWDQDQFLQSRGEVLALAFSPDGHLMASGSSNGTITLWDSRSWKPLRQWTAFNRNAWNLIFSPDGKWLVALGDGATEDEAEVWSTQAWKPISHVQEHSVRGVAFSPDSKWLILSNYGVPDKQNPEYQHPQLNLWRTQGWSLIHTFTQSTDQRDRRKTNYILYVKFTPEGDRFIAEDLEGMMYLWQLHSEDGGRKNIPGANGDDRRQLFTVGHAVVRTPNTPKGWRKI